MELLLVVLGAILATFGGFLQQWYRDQQNQKKEDESILVKCWDILSIMDRYPEIGKMEKSSFECFDDLYQLSFRIRCKNNNECADEIQEFVRKNRGTEPKTSKGLRKEIKKMKGKIEEKIKIDSQKESGGNDDNKI